MDCDVIEGEVVGGEEGAFAAEFGVFDFLHGGFLLGRVIEREELSRGRNYLIFIILIIRIILIIFLVLFLSKNTRRSAPRVRGWRRGGVVGA